MRNTLLDRPQADENDESSPPSATPRLVTWADPPSRFIWRWRLAAVCALLTALAFIQEPGRIATDTKLDLANNPGGLLVRAMHLWDPDSFSGTLQNQAYGYLWPMGPFYWLGEQAGVPSWVMQRLWWALLLCLAFLGMVKLIRLLGMGGPAVRVVAGLAYALSPMMLTKLGPISSEVLPIALAPWMLIPLVRGAQGGSTRKWAALSGIAILCMGGVNAVATAAVLPLALIWILTRERTRRKWTLLGWWFVAVVLACLWWAIPLVMLGKYSPPFLDWIESASITTIASDPFSVMRGSSDWIAHLTDSSGPVWWMGWLFATNRILIVTTAVLAAIGLIGLAMKSLPHRSFIVLSALFGFLFLSLGHVSDLSGFGAATVQSLLDGPLAPLRNLHKFDPVLRVPLVLAMAWAMTRGLQLAQSRANPTTNVWQKVRRIELAPVVAASLAVLILMGAVATGALTKSRSYTEIPPYWGQAANWLANEGGDGKALVVPGASFAQFLWGRTQDEPFQALGGVAWDVRDAVPLGNAGHTRMLDALSAELESGRGKPELADDLTRAGFNYLVVRNDVDTGTIGSAQLSVLHQALDESPGIKRVADFGPEVGAFAPSGYIPNNGVSGSYPAVEIFRIGETAGLPKVILRDASDPFIVVGGPEAVTTVNQAVGLDGRPVLVQGDPGTSNIPGTLIATDTDRRREVNFGYSRDNASNTLTETDAFLVNRPVHDYRAKGSTPTTYAEYEGIESVTASTSSSDATSAFIRDPSGAPFSALDGDLDTSWRTGVFSSPVDQWWRVQFTSPRVVPYVDIVLDSSPAAVRAKTIAVSSEVGTRNVAVNGRLQLRVPVGGKTSFIKIQLAEVNEGDKSPVFGLAEVKIPQLSANRSLRVKSDGPVEGAVLAAASGRRDACVRVSGRYRCAAEISRAGAEQAGIDRWVWLKAGNYVTSLTGSGRAGAALDQLLAPTSAIVVDASSQDVRSPAARGQAASDGDLTTTWLANRLEQQPEITMTLPAPRLISGVRVTSPLDLAVSRPSAVAVTANGQTTRGILDEDGIMRMVPARTDRVTVKVVGSSPTRSQNQGKVSVLPIGISEIELLGAGDVRKGLPQAADVAFACGFGPKVSIDAEQVQTKGSISVHQLLGATSSPFSACGPNRTIALTQGWHRIKAGGSPQISVDSVSVLPAVGLKPVAPPKTPSAIAWDTTGREVAVPASKSAQLLETDESFNAGWTAVLNGQTLQAVQVDGWRQAWLVPANVSGDVSMSFEPDAAYRAGLLVGFGAVLILLLLAFGRARPDSQPEVAGIAIPRVAIVVVAAVSVLTVGVLGTLAASLLAGAVWFVFFRSRFRAPLAIAALVFGALAIELISPWPGSRLDPAWVVGLQASLLTAALLLAVFVGSGGLSAFRSRRARRRSGNVGPCE